MEKNLQKTLCFQNTAIRFYGWHTSNIYVRYDVDVSNLNIFWVHAWNWTSWCTYFRRCTFLLNLAIIAGIIGIPLLVWRIKLISRLFEKGDEVKGSITHIRFNRDRGKIKYEYIYQNQKYQAGNSVFKTGRTKYYQQGDEIVLLVDSENPKKAVIKDLYAKEIV